MLRYLLLCVLATAATSQAIVTRHDRDKALYRKLAEDHPMVCRVGQGMGTLIDSIWVLTAAHVADALPALKATVRFGDRTVGVSLIEMHPDYAVEGKHRDMALLRLAEPITNIDIAQLYRKSDEPGMRVTFVGDGLTGDGKTGPVEGERVLRAAHNVVDSVRTGWLVFTFDAPPAGENLEGISGPGDSGGPALYRKGDSLYILGVSAYNVGDVECTYGTNEYYCRVFDELEWLDGVMSGRLASDKQTCVMTWAKDEAGRQTVTREDIKEVDMPVENDARFVDVVRKLVASVESKSLDDYIALFNEDLLVEQRQKGDPLEGLHEFMLNVCGVRGNIKGFHKLSGKGIQLKDSTHPIRPAVFHLADGISGYFGIALDDSGKIDHLSLFVRDGICPNGKDCTELYSLRELDRVEK